MPTPEDRVAELGTAYRSRWKACPREVRFVAEPPKTPSGKIQRFLLRQG